MKVFVGRERAIGREEDTLRQLGDDLLTKGEGWFGGLGFEEV